MADAGDMEPEVTATELVPMAGTDIEQVERATIDKQIATAKAYPRSLATCISDATSLATRSEEVAQSCIYSLKRKTRDGGSTYIKGKSVRLAEIMLYSWKNIRVDARIITMSDKFLVAQARGIDLERNVGQSVTVMRRITTSDGRTFNDDMLAVTANAAISIARRNVIFALIPNAFTEEVYKEVTEVALGKGKTMEERTARALAYFTKLGLTEREILDFMGVKKAMELTVEQLEELYGYATAIKEGSMTPEDMKTPPTVPVDEKKPDWQPEQPTAPVEEKPAPKAPKKKAQPEPQPQQEPEPKAVEPVEESPLPEADDNIENLFS